MQILSHNVTLVATLGSLGDAHRFGILQIWTPYLERLSLNSSHPCHPRQLEIRDCLPQLNRIH
jgi:hypothetical protein